MKTTITILALTLVAFCGFAADSAVAGDQENIQGTWKLETASLDGKAMPGVTVVYVFTGETLTVRPGVGQEQKATFSLEITSKPKYWLFNAISTYPMPSPTALRMSWMVTLSRSRFLRPMSARRRFPTRAGFFSSSSARSHNELKAE